MIEAAALQKDGNVQITSSRNGSSEDFSDLCMVQAITLEDYNREAKKDETLEDREALVFFEDSPIQQETFSINDMHWKVRQLSADSTMEDSGLKFYVTPVYRIVVKFRTVTGNLEDQQRSLRRPCISGEIRIQL